MVLEIWSFKQIVLRAKKNQKDDFSVVEVVEKRDAGIDTFNSENSYVSYCSTDFDSRKILVKLLKKSPEQILEVQIELKFTWRMIVFLRI